MLTSEHHIRSIIDLRSKTEHKDAGSSNLPLHVPGVSTYEIDFNGHGFQAKLLSQLSWRNKAKLIKKFLSGHRDEAAKIVAGKVMQPKGLVGLAIDSVDASKKEVRRIFNILSDRQQYPIMVHCSHGKDRTGLVTALVMMLLDVPVEDINADYLRSNRELQPMYPSIVNDMAKVGLADDFALCPPQLVFALKSHIDQKYGGIELYLQAAGVTLDQQDKVKQILAG
jgi:protein-tyrosine phosphatase